MYSFVVFVYNIINLENIVMDITVFKVKFKYLFIVNKIVLVDIDGVLLKKKNFYRRTWLYI